jgi:carnitine O-palmitoyltransferase 2
MLRRTVASRLKTKSGVDIADWSRIRDKLAKATAGACFDSTVLDKTIIPTHHLQESLFRLPIPKLEDTCKRYLDAVEPLVAPGSFERTAKHVADFAKGDGQRLHAELLAADKANPRESFISEDWFDLYLRDRTPLPINYNPVLTTRPDPTKKDGLVRAAFWLASTARWYQALRQETLKPEVFFFGSKDHYSRKDWFLRTTALLPRSVSAKFMAIGSQFMAFPLDMSQYHSALCSTRIPQKGVDILRRCDFTPYVVVNHRGHQFKVTIADNNGNPLNEGQLYARLKQIVDLNVQQANVDVGVFTADNRELWAEARINMERDPTCAASLKLVDEAILVLNLDMDTTADLLDCKGAVDATRHFLVSKNNRWWDKSISVTVTKDGHLAVSFEHSWGDGVAVLRYTVDCFNDSVARLPASVDLKQPATEGVHQLKWNLSDPLKESAKKSEANLDKEIKRMDFFTMCYDSFGKSDPVFRGKAKPDPFMQVAMQLAWWRLNKSTVSTYESASTAAFKRGRTECIRSATKESQKFTLIFDKPTATDSEKLTALLAATDKHAAISKDAKMGNGIDRHLFALRKRAERTKPDLKMPEIFADPSYTTFGSNMLSTSSLYSDALIGGGFGPVSPGYGIGYAAADNMLFFNISCWRTNGPQHSAEEFAAAIHDSVTDMHALIKRTEKGK